MRDENPEIDDLGYRLFDKTSHLKGLWKSSRLMGSGLWTSDISERNFLMIEAAMVLTAYRSTGIGENWSKFFYNKPAFLEHNTSLCQLRSIVLPIPRKA